MLELAADQRQNAENEECMASDKEMSIAECFHGAVRESHTE